MVFVIIKNSSFFILQKTTTIQVEQIWSAAEATRKYKLGGVCPQVLWHSEIVHHRARVTVPSLVFIFWSDLTWMAFKSKYHMAYVTSRDTLVIKIHYAGVRRHWDASHHDASFGRLKIWRLRKRLHYTVVILNNLLRLARSPALIHNAYDLQLARTLSLLRQSEGA